MDEVDRIIIPSFYGLSNFILLLSLFTKVTKVVRDVTLRGLHLKTTLVRGWEKLRFCGLVVDENVTFLWNGGR